MIGLMVTVVGRNYKMRLIKGIPHLDINNFTEELNAYAKKLIQERKFKECLHPNTKQGCCDFCGKDMVGE